MNPLDTLAGLLALRAPGRRQATLTAVALAAAAALALLGLRFLVSPAVAAPGGALSSILRAPAAEEIESDSMGESQDYLLTSESRESSVDWAEAGDQEAGRPVFRGTTSYRGGSRSVDPAPAASPTPEPKQSTGDRIASIARQYLGYRYAWGGSSPRTGFDCSGFAWFAYKEAGVAIPIHDLAGQLRAGPRIPRGDLLPGDLVFFENTYTWGLSHDGIYLGDGQFIHAETYGTGVRISSLNERGWGSHYMGASRPWDDR